MRRKEKPTAFDKNPIAFWVLVAITAGYAARNVVRSIIRKVS